MKTVLKFFKENQPKTIIRQKIKVFGYLFELSDYEDEIVSSVTNYLFEPLEIIENIAPIENTNRDGRIRPKRYITIHDTGSTPAHHTAKFWSEVVRTGEIAGKKYNASFQYVTGNDGVYHNIPDNEIAYHAGDTTQFDYSLIDAEVNGDNPQPKITISQDGYYEIDGVKSKVKAPMVEEKKDGVLTKRIPETKDINQQGILCKLIGGRYFIGITYFNTDYNLIANRGGNNNSIGIESCVNQGSDLHLTWQRTAKLVAQLLYTNKLTFNDIKQHHYFSGKNCPMTMRENNLYDHVMELIKMEYYVLKFRKEGYEVSLVCDDKRVSPNGRIKLNEGVNEDIKFKIQVKKDEKMIEEEFSIEVI